VKTVGVYTKQFIETVEQARKGDPAALRALLVMRQKSILFRATRILNDIRDAEDAAQEVMIIVFNKISGLRDATLFDAWLSRIIVNTCNNIHNKNNRRGGELNIEDHYGDIREQDPGLLPEASAERKEAAAAVRDQVADLPERRRRVIELYYMENKTYAEIARELNVAIPTVSAHINQAKKELRKRMEGKADKL
jgi:RNA polymerase sigma factor (sigma-70 family)